MRKNLGHIERILKFENSSRTTVLDFNEMFPEAPIKNRSPKAEVQIFDVAGPEYRRNLMVDGERITHDFKIVHGSSETPKRPEWKRNHGHPTNRGLRNTVMTDVELKLIPNHYYLLQYMRGSINSHHTILEIDSRTSMGYHVIKRSLLEMENLGILDIDHSDDHRFKVTLTEDWH